MTNIGQKVRDNMSLITDKEWFEHHENSFELKEHFAGSIEEARDEAVTCLTNIKECIEEVIEGSDE